MLHYLFKPEKKMSIKPAIKFYLPIIVISIATFLSLPSAMAVQSASAAPPPTRICEIIGTNLRNLSIVAGPKNDLSTCPTCDPKELASEFPETIACPGDATKLCANWHYRFIWKNMSPSLAYVDLSSDQAVKSINDNGSLYGYPPLSVEPTGSGLNNYDVRWIRWTSNASTYEANFITPIAKARIASAGGKSGNFQGFCLIQGAGQVTETPPAYTSEKKTTTADGNEFCTQVNPATQCEVGVDCQTREILPSVPLSDVVGVDGYAATYVAIPGQQCPTFVTDNGTPHTRYYCSGGYCYVYP
jgi:hypothetical protein